MSYTLTLNEMRQFGACPWAIKAFRRRWGAKGSPSLTEVCDAIGRLRSAIDRNSAIAWVLCYADDRLTAADRSALVAAAARDPWSAIDMLRGASFWLTAEQRANLIAVAALDPWAAADLLISGHMGYKLTHAEKIELEESINRDDDAVEWVLSVLKRAASAAAAA